MHTRFAPRRWLGACAFAATLLLSGGLRSATVVTPDAIPDTETFNAAGQIDDSTTAAGYYYAILCNTCSTTADFVNKAVTTYPRVRNSAAYVYNLTTGRIKTIALDWDAEANVQAAGFELPTDARVEEYISAVGDLYRRNGNSTNFKMVVRSGGSAYLTLTNGSKWEVLPGRKIEPEPGPTTPIPARNSPIDLRGYTFGSGFNAGYPNYPRTSQDLAFGGHPHNIDPLLHDVMTPASSGSGYTVVFKPDATVPRALIQQLTGTVTVFLPMKDGGYARVSYDMSTGAVSLRQVFDASGVDLPIGGNPLQFYANYTWNFGANAGFAHGSFVDWAMRNNIPIVDMWYSGGTGRVECVSRSINEVTCTIYPN